MSGSCRCSGNTCWMSGWLIWKGNVFIRHCKTEHEALRSRTLTPPSLGLYFFSHTSTWLVYGVVTSFQITFHWPLGSTGDPLSWYDCPWHQIVPRLFFFFFRKMASLQKEILPAPKVDNSTYIMDLFVCFFSSRVINPLSSLFENTSKTKSHKQNCKTFPLLFLYKKLLISRKMRGGGHLFYMECLQSLLTISF